MADDLNWNRVITPAEIVWDTLSPTHAVTEHVVHTCMLWWCREDCGPTLRALVESGHVVKVGKPSWPKYKRAPGAEFHKPNRKDT